MEQPAVSAIVLAGGASSRMGFNKAFARLGQGGTLIEKAVAKVAMLSPDVIVVANDEETYRNLGVRVSPDVYPGTGSLGGIYSGLLAAQHQHALVVACDMPFLSLPLWRYMLSIPRDYDVLLPRLHGQPEPLHAIYSKQCVGPIKDLLERGRLKIIGFLHRVKVRFLDEVEIEHFDPEHRSFFNVNRPEELARAAALWPDSEETGAPQRSPRRGASSDGDGER